MDDRILQLDHHPGTTAQAPKDDQQQPPNFDDYSLIGTSTFSEAKTFYLLHRLKTAYDSTS